MKKTPVLIDCDTGIDDMISFVLTLASEKLDILGVTTVAGNVNLKLTTYNTVNGLAVMGRPEIPVVAGSDRPILREYVDASEIHGNTGIGDYRFSDPIEPKTLPGEAVEFLYQKLMKAEKPVTILALAPLTNIALLLRAHPDCKCKIDKIVFMGGSLCTGNPTPITTFNVLVDPDAAKMVLKEGVPFYMCPLNTTRKAYMSGEDLERIRTVQNPVAAMISSMLKVYEKNANGELKTTKRFGGVCVHDLCTAAFVTNPELFETVRYYADVETKGEITTGFTMIDYEDNLKKPEEEKNIYYIHSVDREGMLKVFFDALDSYTK